MKKKWHQQGQKFYFLTHQHNKIMATTPKKAINLEKSLEQLETLVEKMEDGETSLDESLKLFEKGVTLVKQCQTTLTKAEQKVQKLTKENEEYLLTDFEKDE